jgi:hypothetical protein
MRGVCGRPGSVVLIGDTVDDVSLSPRQGVDRPPALLVRPARGAARAERLVGRGVCLDRTLIGRRRATTDCPDRDDRAAARDAATRRAAGDGSS